MTTVQAAVPVIVPEVPESLAVERPGRLVSSMGSTVMYGVPIGSLPDAVLRQVGEDWTEALLYRASLQRIGGAK